jgi:NADH-quinone oxidoreductase subunit M
MLRLMQGSMFGESNDITAKFKDVSGSEVAVLLPIAAVVLIMGLFPNVFLKITEPAVNSILQMMK